MPNRERYDKLLALEGTEGAALLCATEAQSQAGLFAIRGSPVNRAGLGGFVKSGAETAQGLGRVLFLTRAQQFKIRPLERMEPGFGASVAGLFAAAVAHPAFS
jgi:hypothetical protein